MFDHSKNQSIYREFAKTKMTTAAYIHIPFCQHICSYCDFPKFLYQEKWILPYLKALRTEIQEKYKGEKLKTIYIGGGTPTCLDDESFLYLLKIISILKKRKKYEYTIECNIENLNERKIELMKQYGVNRISIGVETFHEKHLKNLNRRHTKEQVQNMIQLLKKYQFHNINIDLIYALPNETKEEVKEDILNCIELGVPHISLYSLMIEPNTLFYIQKVEPISEDLDFEMYQIICNILKEYGYQHYEVSNFAYSGYQSTHNLTYWNNEFYYGFGLGASGFIESIRYQNTKNFKKYCQGYFIAEREKMNKVMNMENEMILGLRKLKGVNQSRFRKKYGINIENVFPIQELIRQGKLQKKRDWISIKEEDLYLSNDILVEFIGKDKQDNS